MDRRQFVSHVAERAGIESEEEAAKAVEATFQTLAERIIGDEAEHLAAQLPPEVTGPLAGAGNEAEVFDLDEFVRRVAERAGTDDGEALNRAQAVFATTAEAVTEEEWSDVLSQLPNDYQPLLAKMAGG